MTFGLETRSEGADPSDIDLAPLTAAVEEIRSAAEAGRTAIETRIGKLAERLDAIDVRTQRPSGKSDETDESKKIETRAFAGLLRHGREMLAPEEVRALRVSDDTAGGYLAPADFVAEVIKGIVEFSPVRQAARVGSTASGSVILPKRTGTPTASWVGETETRPSTEATYGQSEIPINEAACYVDVSIKLLEDAAVNVESEVAGDLAEQFGKLEGYAFLRGDGVKKPVGLLNASGVSYTASGNASTLGSAPADLLITAMYALPAFYRNSGAWMMNGTTLATIRKLKDGQGNFLWQPSYQAGQPETILGRPVVEAVDMPDIGSGTEPIIFGNFERAYRIYDRVALSILRDPYSVATSGLVRFHARRRTGGGTVLAEAFRKIRCATS